MATHGAGARRRRARRDPDVLGAWAVVPAGLGLVAAVGVVVAAHRRQVTLQRVLGRSGSDEGTLPAGVLPFVLAAVVVAGGVAAAVVVVVTAVGR